MNWLADTFSAATKNPLPLGMGIVKEKFLAVYKDYETVVRNAGTEPIKVEDEVDESTQARLRLCRQFRNYLSHNNDAGFIEPTEKMVAFLTEQYQLWAFKNDVVKKHLRTPASSICSSNDKCSVALDKMCKLKSNHMVVFDETDVKYKVVAIFDVVAAIAASKTSKLSDVKAVKMAIDYVAPTKLMSEMRSDVISICTSDGTVSGKCLGIVK